MSDALESWLNKKPDPLLLYPILAIIFLITFGSDFLIMKSIEILTGNINSPASTNVDEVNQYNYVINFFNVFHGLSYTGLILTAALIFVYALAVHRKILTKQSPKSALKETLRHVRSSLIGIVTINLSFASLIWIIILVNFAITLPLTLLLIATLVLIPLYIITAILLLVYASLELLCLYTELW